MLMTKIHKLRGLRIQSLNKHYEHNRSLLGDHACGPLFCYLSLNDGTPWSVAN